MLKRGNKMVAVAKEKRKLSGVQLRRAIKIGGVLTAKVRGRLMISTSEVREYFRPGRTSQPN